MKYEWRKNDKAIYLPGAKPVAIQIPPFRYFALKGRGNPNGEAFEKAIEALYALSYGIRMMPKKGVVPDGYYEYTVFPLEGVWDLDEEGRKLEKLEKLDKDRLVYKLMIRQPSFVTEELLLTAKNGAKSKVAEQLLESVALEEIDEGLCVQCMHTGSYDNEPATFALMERFAESNQLRRIDKRHREIYVSDARKTSEDRLKTVLRFKAANI